GGEIDLVGRRDRLDAGSENDGIPDQGTFLVQDVTERDHDAHSEAVVALVRLGKPELLLHGHRGQAGGRHTREYQPEPVALRLHDTTIVSKRVATQELAV